MSEFGIVLFTGSGISLLIFFHSFYPVLTWLREGVILKSITFSVILLSYILSDIFLEEKINITTITDKGYTSTDATDSPSLEELKQDTHLMFMRGLIVAFATQMNITYSHDWRIKVGINWIVSVGCILNFKSYDNIVNMIQLVTILFILTCMIYNIDGNNKVIYYKQEKKK